MCVYVCACVYVCVKRLTLSQYRQTTDTQSMESASGDVLMLHGCLLGRYKVPL